MAKTANFSWPIPEDGDGQQNGKPWGASYREFLEEVDDKLHEVYERPVGFATTTVSWTAASATGDVALGKLASIRTAPAPTGRNFPRRTR